MKTKQYKVIIQYHASQSFGAFVSSDAQKVMLFESKRNAFDTYDRAACLSCVAWAALLDPSGKQIFDA